MSAPQIPPAPTNAETSSLWSDGSSIRASRLGTPIEADSDVDGESILTTESVRASVVALLEENGRTYDGYGQYFLPNDQAESERLDLQYYAIHVLLGNRIHFAPIERPKRVLDIGCGTNPTWCRHMGAKYKDARIYGWDINAMMTVGEIASNVRIELCDPLKDQWPSSDPFDYVHTRMMLGSFNDFREVIKRSFKELRPGGWMESQELWPRIMCDDGTLNPDTNKFCEFIKFQDEAFMRLGAPMRIANKLKRWYQDAGFIDVKEEIFRIPINGWPRDPRYKLLGKSWGKSLVDGLPGFAMYAFTHAFEWTREEVEVYLVDVRKAVRDKSVHAYHSIYVVYGRKPTIEEQRQIDRRKLAQTSAKREQMSLEAAMNGTSLNEKPSSSDNAQTAGQPSSTHWQQGNSIQQTAHIHAKTAQNSFRRPLQPFSASPHSRS